MADTNCNCSGYTSIPLTTAKTQVPLYVATLATKTEGSGNLYTTKRLEKGEENISKKSDYSLVFEIHEVIYKISSLTASNTAVTDTTYTRQRGTFRWQVCYTDGQESLQCSHQYRR